METIVGILVGTALGSSLGMFTALLSHEFGRRIERKRWNEKHNTENK